MTKTETLQPGPAPDDSASDGATPIASLAVERGRQGVTVSEHGTISCDGPDAVNLYRLLTIKGGLELEARTGGRMRLTRRAPSCYTIARREFGLKGSKLAIYRGFCERHGFATRPDVIACLQAKKPAAAPAPDDDASPEIACEACGAPAAPLGQLGSRMVYRCRACGADS